MPRSIWRGLFGLFSVAAVACIPLACQSGGIGDPCTPEDEENAQFSGFAMAEEYIESRSFQCATRLCLVNHFQGRVSCPLGQPASAVTDCLGPSGPSDDLCDKARGERCVEAAGASPSRFVCHKPGDCQQPGASPADNAGKACCVPGTDTPVGSPVCGQCSKKSRRDAEQAVYCSCRCGVADGAPQDPDSSFCACPTGFTCSQIRRDLAISDRLLTGKYCIKEGTEYAGDLGACGAAPGNHESPCLGIEE